MSEVEIFQGECSELIGKLEENSLDACITDPPYETSFMNKDWDRSGIAFDPKFWEKVKRVLKPGAHLVVFGGSETFHRIAVGIEDAGFEIRDSIDWIYAEGFAKSYDVSEAIDEHLGEERPIVGIKDGAQRADGSMVQRDSYKGDKDNPAGWQERGRDPYERAPATEEADAWEGWDTQLKPAKEPVLIARNPIEDTVAKSVLEHGTGALNVDGCRISPEGQETSEGRWPANVIFDSEMAQALDDQSGRDLTAGGSVKEKKRDDHEVYGEYWGTSEHESYGDSGGASRYFKTIGYHPLDNPKFFYCQKAKRKERDIGCGEGEEVEKNDHVTVKPIELMAYLVRMFVPEGGKVLDPFAGSGTTGVAATLENTDCMLVELGQRHADICEARVGWAQENALKLRREIYGDPSNQITKEQTKVHDHNFW